MSVCEYKPMHWWNKLKLAKSNFRHAIFYIFYMWDFNKAYKCYVSSNVFGYIFGKMRTVFLCTRTVRDQRLTHLRGAPKSENVSIFDTSTHEKPLETSKIFEKMCQSFLRQSLLPDCTCTGFLSILDSRLGESNSWKWQLPNKIKKRRSVSCNNWANINRYWNYFLKIQFYRTVRFWSEWYFHDDRGRK